jgi:DNA-binding CsgD family transcriptional regulator
MTSAASTTSLVGRHDERRTIDTAVDGARQGRPTTLLVVGEPGIGKSALLADVRARHPDAAILATAGIESEHSIPFATLTALFADQDANLERLDPRAAGLLRAVAAGGSPASLPAVAVALVELIATISDHGLVLVELDDVHWFDPSSLAVIEFALRRLGHLPVVTVAASRRPDALDLASTVIALGPLDHDSAQILLDANGTVVGEVSRRCWDLCGGNPLTLIQVGMTLTADQRTGARALPELLPVAGRLKRWLADRIDVLPATTRTALATLALAGSVPPAALLEALDRLGLHRRDLDTAEAAGVVECHGVRVAFSHPLYATVAAAAVDGGKRRTIHRVLAATMSGTCPERQAWHLVEACETPADIAAATSGLRALAERADAGGAHLAAADAWERLASLLTHADERSRALTAAGNAAWSAGRPDLAVPLLSAARQLVAPGPTRAMATDVLGQVVGWTDSIGAARRLLEAEVSHVEADHPDLAVQLLVSAATLASLAIAADATALADRAEAIATRGSEYTRIASRTVGTHVRLMSGDGSIAARLADLDALGAVVGDGDGIDRSFIELAQLLAFGSMVRERWDDARSRYEHLIAAARSASLGGVETFGLAMSAEVAWRTGRWSRARADAAFDAAFHAPLAGLQGTFGGATLARVEAALGLVDDARAHACAAVERGDQLGMHSMGAWGRHALGLADLADGDPASAVVHLEWIWNVERASGANDAGLLWWQGDLLEALIAVGRRDDARHLVDQLAAEAAVTGRRWPAAIAARGRGVVEGDIDELRGSVAALDALDAPFEAARSRLLLSSLLDGDDGHACLEDARIGFERLGALPWADRCRAAGSAHGDRSPRRPVLAAQLTPAELRVATAVGSGMTTRDAAASLALSTRTVDAHLRSIFRKLQITSRTQLAVLISSPAHGPR